MRVFCPSCQEPVTIADDLAGKATFCPLCKAAFTAPTLFSPPPAPLTPPPVPTPPPASDPSFSLEPPPAAPTPVKPETKVPPTPVPDQPRRPAAPPGSSKTFGLVIPAEVIQWTAPAFLIVAVFLSFFSWNGAFPGDYDVYTQGPWRAITGTYEFDEVGESVIHLNEPPAEGKKGLKESVHSNWLTMLAFLFLLFVTTALAVALTVLPTLSLKLPPQVQNLMPYRMVLIAGLGLLMMVILGFRSLGGFGLENAIVERIDEGLQSEREKAKLPDEKMKFNIKRESQIGALNVRHTTALRLEMLALIVAVVGAGLAFGLSRRRDRHGLRIDVTW
jgi:hypothetical protein